MTCLCSSYNLPHRISGGRCDCSEWCDSYIQNDGSECSTCNSKTVSGECEVSAGAEDIKHCPAYQELLRTQDAVRYPLTFENSNMWDDYLDNPNLQDEGAFAL